ncbi:uncharacterized protein N7483_004779 [Penicillium malachiteum]|uniref:uncharacterized protein n=1 Tax=Penicillium malachiteum TaxID=1324776 RepID=UPI0025478FF5|nr:uncharacterized protein N7483_004779 [Penicillium malachiteum]KAJ5730271.1 hypothetical protein N7483_004779 [Penicillium malachiteum]
MAVTCGGNLHMATVVTLDLHTKIPSELAITEITTITEPKINQKCLEMESPRVKRIDPPNYKPRVSDPKDAKSRDRSREGSRPTSAVNSGHHSRSASRSTARSRPASRQSSFHSSRRPVTTASIVSVPARTPQQERRESLLELHRESCRLFQDPPAISPTEDFRPSSTQRNPSFANRYRRTSSDMGTSAPPSPIASSSSSRRFDDHHRRSISSGSVPQLQTRTRSNTLPTTHHIHNSSTSSIHVPETVMEWTSPSTRRREYEKIDRASRGMRGLWRRVAPRWCQARDARTPFFEEGKTSREGSVRRFRMDLPDEEQTHSDPKRDGSGAGPVDVDFCNSDASRRLWTGRRSKTLK